jgi:hypothetical protein
MVLGSKTLLAAPFILVSCSQMPAGLVSIFFFHFVAWLRPSPLGIPAAIRPIVPARTMMNVEPLVK